MFSIIDNDIYKFALENPILEPHFLLKKINFIDLFFLDYKYFQKVYNLSFEIIDSFNQKLILENVQIPKEILDIIIYNIQLYIDYIQLTYGAGNIKTFYILKEFLLYINNIIIPYIRENNSLSSDELLININVDLFNFILKFNI